MSSNLQDEVKKQIAEEKKAKQLKQIRERLYKVEQINKRIDELEFEKEVLEDEIEQIEEEPLEEEPVEEEPVEEERCCGGYTCGTTTNQKPINSILYYYSR
jgi:hypothetical protein